MLKIIILPFFFICFCLSQLGAQAYALDGVKAVSPHSIQAIHNGKDVAGYIIFYKKDKADSKNDNYGFDLTDEKLNKVSSVKVVLPRNAVFLQAAYNGAALGLMFYDQKKKTYIYRSFDKSLKELGSLTSEKPNKWELAALNQMSGGDTDEAFYFFGIRGVQDKGFVRSGYGKKNDQYKVTFYDNNFKKVWDYETPAASKDFEAFTLMDANPRYVVGSTTRRKGALSKKMDYSLTIFDAESGKKLVDISPESGKQQLSLSSAMLLEGKDEVLIQGEYYDEDDKAGVDKSKGFYIKTYDIKTGKHVTQNLYSWGKEISKLLPKAGKESIEDGYQNYPQALFKAASGKYYMIFEQFKKTTDAGGIAMLALGGSASAVKVRVGNLWALEMDTDFKPLAVKYYEKDGSNVFLPPGSSFLGSGMLGYYTRWIGGFDYQFLQGSNDGKTFNAAYINYDREKGEKTKTVVGNVFMAEDGSINFDGVDITAAKKTKLFLYPATPGNVMLAEFRQKDKRLEFKMVKLNY
jgi:hypothetical protein